MIDRNREEKLYFEEIIRLLEIIIKGTKNEKLNFIFKFLTHPNYIDILKKKNLLKFFKIQIYEEYNKDQKD